MEREMANLDLQQIISTDAFVMHLMVSIIRIATALIFNKGESTFRVNDIRVASSGE